MPTLYYGDNLHVMREHLKDESVRLDYLLNSKKTKNEKGKKGQEKLFE